MFRHFIPKNTESQSYTIRSKNINTWETAQFKHIQCSNRSKNINTWETAQLKHIQYSNRRKNINTWETNESPEKELNRNVRQLIDCFLIDWPIKSIERVKIHHFFYVSPTLSAPKGVNIVNFSSSRRDLFIGQFWYRLAPTFCFGRKNAQGGSFDKRL